MISGSTTVAEPKHRRATPQNGCQAPPAAKPKPPSTSVAACLPHWSDCFVATELRTGALDAGLLESASTSTATENGRSFCESPVFLLSAGWRSGSTLLQRLVSSDSRTVIWGEPFGDLVPIPRLVAMLRHFRSDDVHLRYDVARFRQPLGNQWIANLNPGAQSFHAAHRRFVESWLAEPARRHGYARWGAKWVRLSGYHAQYLRWLYPQCRIVFLVRHPLDAYQSYKGNLWPAVRGRSPVKGPLHFFAQWRYMASSFLACADQLDAHFVRYEDLTGRPDAVDALESYLNLPIDRSVLDNKLKGTQSDGVRVSWPERLLYRMVAGSLCDQLGYRIGSAWG